MTFIKACTGPTNKVIELKVWYISKQHVEPLWDVLVIGIPFLLLVTDQAKVVTVSVKKSLPKPNLDC